MKTLSMKDLDKDPIRQFDIWLGEARQTQGINDAEAFCLSTLDIDGYPNGRMLLLKGVSAEGFLFFSNCNSTKGKALNKLPKASMTFYWDPLERQVRIQGDIVLASEKEADEFFSNRERSHQLGSVASLQSEILDSREVLEDRIKKIDLHYNGQEVPRPEYWIGYKLIPKRIEFWQKRENAARMNDRYAYFLANNSWEIKCLYP